MVWQPGQSGNPTGEGRKGKAEKLAELASIYSRSAINTLAGIMENPEAKDADRITAARMLLDRAVGTPVQAVNVSSSVTISLVELLAGLPGPRPATIEHEEEPPPLVAGISLQDATEAAEELAGQEAATDDGRSKDRAAELFASLGETIAKLGDVGEGRFGQEEEDELVLLPANDDGTPTQPGGE